MRTERVRLLPQVTVMLALLFAMQANAQSSQPKVELFAGAELHYRDIFYNRMYDVLVNLTQIGRAHV